MGNYLIVMKALKECVWHAINNENEELLETIRCAPFSDARKKLALSDGLTQSHQHSLTAFKTSI